MLPFTAEEFFAVFSDYNESVWPMQWVLTAVAIAVLLLSFSRAAWRDRGVCVSLAGLWAWTAIAYHLVHFSRINPAAYLFGIAFLVQASLFLWWAGSNRRVALSFRLDLRGILGALIAAYALIAYPLLSSSLGHTYPSTPTFGVPCPTTIFTLGVLTMARVRRLAILFVVPLLWSLVGGSAAFLLGVWPDLGLIVSAIVALAVMGLNGTGARS